MQALRGKASKGVIMTRDPSDGSVRPAIGIPITEQKQSDYTALKARHGETWGIKQPDPPPKSNFKSMSAEQLAQHYAKHNLGFEVKAETEEGA